MWRPAPSSLEHMWSWAQKHIWTCRALWWDGNQRQEQSRNLVTQVPDTLCNEQRPCRDQDIRQGLALRVSDNYTDTMARARLHSQRHRYTEMKNLSFNFWDLGFWLTMLFFSLLQTFDECVAEGGSDCAPEKLWLQIPFFCGHSSECW